MSGPASEISLLTFSEFGDTTERRFLEGENLIDDLAAAKSLYQVENIPRGTGDRRVYKEVDTETYASYKAEGADATKKQVVTGWEKTMSVRRFAAEIDITYEARNYGKNQEILKKLTSLATFCPQRMALDLTHRFTFATATSYTDLDGETVDISMGYTTTTALVDGTHDLTGSATTYNNVITGNPAFSQGGFEVALEITNTQILSNFAERRIFPMSSWKIVTGDDPSTCRQVQQLLNSMADVTGSHEGIVNVYKNYMSHVKLPRMATTATGAYNSAKKTYWGLVAAGEWNGYLGIWEEAHLKKPAPGNNGEDLHNDNWTFGARCGYGVTVVAGRGVVWSTGVGA